MGEGGWEGLAGDEDSGRIKGGRESSSPNTKLSSQQKLTLWWECGRGSLPSLGHTPGQTLVLYVCGVLRQMFRAAGWFQAGQWELGVVLVLSSTGLTKNPDPQESSTHICGEAPSRSFTYAAKLRRGSSSDNLAFVMVLRPV